MKLDCSYFSLIKLSKTSPRILTKNEKVLLLEQRAIKVLENPKLQHHTLKQKLGEVQTVQPQNHPKIFCLNILPNCTRFSYKLHSCHTKLCIWNYLMRKCLILSHSCVILLS